jgi:hypothetical protein
MMAMRDSRRDRLMASLMGLGGGGTGVTAGAAVVPASALRSRFSSFLARRAARPAFAAAISSARAEASGSAAAAIDMLGRATTALVSPPERPTLAGHGSL